MERDQQEMPGQTAQNALSLQELPLDVETPSETRFSANSIYLCLDASFFSVGC